MLASDTHWIKATWNSKPRTGDNERWQQAEATEAKEKLDETMTGWSNGELVVRVQRGRMRWPRDKPSTASPRYRTASQANREGKHNQGITCRKMAGQQTKTIWKM